MLNVFLVLHEYDELIILVAVRTPGLKMQCIRALTQMKFPIDAILTSSSSTFISME